MAGTELGRMQKPKSLMFGCISYKLTKHKVARGAKWSKMAVNKKIFLCEKHREWKHGRESDGSGQLLPQWDRGVKG